MHEIRWLTDKGVASFVDFVRRAPNDPALSPPMDLLLDGDYSLPVGRGVRIESRPFASKLEFARYINGQFGNNVQADVIHSKRLWGWLALFYFDQLCPPRDGRRSVLKSIARYYGEGSGMGHHLDKHLLYFPWKMHAIHGDQADWMLTGELGTDTKVLRELMNSYRLNVNPAFVAIARSLYYDEAAGVVRRGATNTNKGGSLRELDRMFGRLDLTYDLFNMDPERLKILLPSRRFGRWFTKSVRTSLA